MGIASASAEATSFGKYALVAKLATGGMAEIFLARFRGAGGFEKLVCIKRILPQFAEDPQFVGMFLAEARIAAQISHPNVCQVYELGEIDGRFYIAMEYLAGVPLACFRRRDLYPAAIEPRLVAGLGVQACEGLHHAHQLTRPDGSPLEVVHRDVSGNNLFATVDGIVKVLDFGIAKIQDTSVRTSTGSVKGTYAYMAPEQLRGERVDRRTDVFAMGIVLWELIARRHLFSRETEYLTFQAITADPIPNVCEVRHDLPPLLGEVIARALARDRDVRFPSARALGDALTEAVAPLGGPLSPPAISDEIARAFGSRLQDQRLLIQTARAGGQLDLDNSVGPGVGHGTEMVTTPISIVSSPGIPMPVPRQPSARPYASSPASSSSPAYALQPGPRSVTLSVPPLPPMVTPSSRWWIPVALLIVVGGAIAIFYLWINRAPPQPVAAARPIMADAAVALAPRDAAVVAIAMDPSIDAPPTAAPADAARASGRSPDNHLPQPPAHPLPPGFITIDSSPVYAVITIDGKNLGETPLVNIALTPGKHVVHAVSPSGAVRNVTITIESGKRAPARRIEW